MSPGGRGIAWRFMRDNWDEVHRRYGEGGFGLMYLVEITSGFTTQDRLDEVQKFFEDNPTPAAERTVRQSLEKISLNIAWLDKNRDSLAKWLSP
jgi:puromycin-sensitive aminopeptidase